MDRRNEKQFEFLWVLEDWALQQEDTLINQFLEQEESHREQEHSVMERLIELVAK